jgi:hypothetical protein
VPDHPFHKKVGELFKGDEFLRNLSLFHGQIRIDPACDEDSPGVVTLFHGTGSDRVRFCLVDILIIARDKVVIIEIEESDVKPLHLFGKFYASAFSTHHGKDEIGKKPLLFIQVLDTSKLNLEEGQKNKQWDRIEQVLSDHAENWVGRSIQYSLCRGNSGEFEQHAEKGRKLTQTIREFLAEKRG